MNPFVWRLYKQTRRDDLILMIVAWILLPIIVAVAVTLLWNLIFDDLQTTVFETYGLLWIIIIVFVAGVVLRRLSRFTQLR